MKIYTPTSANINVYSAKHHIKNISTRTIWWTTFNKKYVHVKLDADHQRRQLCHHSRQPPPRDPEDKRRHRHNILHKTLLCVLLLQTIKVFPLTAYFCDTCVNQDYVGCCWYQPWCLSQCLCDAAACCAFLNISLPTQSLQCSQFLNLTPAVFCCPTKLQRVFS